MNPAVPWPGFQDSLPPTCVKLRFKAVCSVICSLKEGEAGGGTDGKKVARGWESEAPMRSLGLRDCPRESMLLAAFSVAVKNWKQANFAPRGDWLNEL